MSSFTSLRRTLSISTSTSASIALPSAPVLASSTSTSSEPPRKRPRIVTQLDIQRTEPVHSGTEDMEEKCMDDTALLSLDMQPERDERFYFSEADCVVRVGGTLFKVHKFMLARDASAFQDMFSIPLDSESDEVAGLLKEGGSDANPIVLYGETEDEFRILLSALYALPAELQQYSTSHSDISRLITISHLTNKYHFTSTSQWAITTLYHVLTRYSSPPLTSSGSPLTSPTSPTRAPTFGWDVERLPEEYDLNTCSPELLSRIIDVAMVCGHDELSALVENRIVERLWSTRSGDQTSFQFSREDEAKWAVNVADRWEMKRLRGVAYYVCLMEMGEDLSRVAQGLGEEDAAGSSDDTMSMHGHVTTSTSYPAIGNIGPPPPLTPLQTTRLLLGHLSLTHLWDTQLQLHAPVIPAPSLGACTYHQHGCSYTWNSAWREAARSHLTVKHKTNDVLGRVRSMEKQLLGNEGLIVALTPGCRRKALCAIRERVKSLEENLGEHFRGVIGGEL